MAVGFRKSLFGFNCNDVIEYIEKTHKSFTNREKDLNSKVDKLSDELDLSNSRYDALNAEKLEIERKLTEYNEKYEEIERLSENIGKLYLVAQANAQAIMENSESSARLSAEEVDRNLCSIEEAHTSLSELKESITKTSEDFVAEVEKLMSSLSITKEKLSEKAEASLSAKNTFDEIYESIVK